MGPEPGPPGSTPGPGSDWADPATSGGARSPRPFLRGPQLPSCHQRNTRNPEAARSHGSGPRALLGPAGREGLWVASTLPLQPSGLPLAARLPRAAPSPLDMTAPHGHPHALYPVAGAPRPTPSSQMTVAPRQVGLESARQASGGAPSASLQDHGSEPEATPGTGRASKELQDGHRAGTGRAGIQRGQCWAQGRHRVDIHRGPHQAQGRHPQSYGTGTGQAQGGQASTEAHAGHRAGIHRVMAGGAGLAWGFRACRA